MDKKILLVIPLIMGGLLFLGLPNVKAQDCTGDPPGPGYICDMGKWIPTYGGCTGAAPGPNYICDMGKWIPTGTGNSTDQTQPQTDSTNQTQPQTRIGNVIMPNFIGYDSISALLAAIANFIITNIAIPFAVIMIIYSGFLFVTAGGNEEKIKKAKKNLAWTILGVAIVLAANILIGYITELLGGPSAGIQPFLDRIKQTLNQIIVVVFALATVYFFWGMVMFMRATGSGDEQGVTTGKRHMIWGVIGMAVMGGAFPIINLLIGILEGR